MDDNVIDTLKIEVVGDSDKAISNIDKLISTLDKIEGTASGADKSFSKINDKLKEINSSTIGSTKLQNTLSNITKTLSRTNSEASKTETRFNKALSKLEEYLSELSNIQNVTDNMLKKCDTSEQVNNLLAIEQQEIETLNRRYSKQLEIVQRIIEAKAKKDQNAQAVGKLNGLNAKLEETASKIENIGDKAPRAVKKAEKAIGSLSNKSSKSIGKIISKYTKLLTLFGKRVAYRALNAVIDMITSSFKEGIDAAYQYSKTIDGSFAKSLDTISTSFNYLKGSLGAMTAPLINMTAPAIDFVVDKFVDLLNIANQVFARLSGESTWLRATKVATEYADATDAATDANKRLKKTLLGIDELNVMSDNSENGSKSGANDNSKYNFVEEQLDTAYVDGVIDKLKNVLSFVEAIGVAFLTWKISKGLLKGLDFIQKFKMPSFELEFAFLGGTDLLFNLKRFSEYIEKIKENGANFENVIGAVGTGLQVLGDALVVFGGKKFGAALIMLGSVTELAGVIRDISKNGFNIENTTAFATCIGSVMFAIGILSGNNKLSGLGLTIKGISNIVKQFDDIWEAIKTGDWSGVDKASLLTSAIEAVVGVATTFGVFSKLKGLFKASDVKSTLGEVSSATETVSAGTSGLTTKLTSLVKDLGLGIAIIAEVAVAAGIIVGSIWGLGLLLEQVGIAWQPVLDNGVTVTTAMIIGTASLAVIGGLTAALDSVGTSLIVNIALGTAILAELGVATGLFLAEIWAIGWGLDQIRIAWQPVLDNGGTIATAIGIGTGILIAIGAVTALLGVAATATGGLLPLAIGLGTAMLLELGAAALLFIAEIWAIGKGLDEVGKAWQPVLDNGDTISKGIERGTELLIAVGAVTALLGVASLATGMLLPVAIGLGTKLLVDMGDAVVDFNDSLVNVAKSFSNKLQPALQELNGKLPPLSDDMEDFTGFMKFFAGQVVDYSKSSAISGFASTVDSIIKFFTKDPIKSMANDVDKQYEQSIDLNKKLEKANPELETAIRLVKRYYDFLEELERLTGKTNNISLANGMFTSMKEVGKNLVSGFVDGIKAKTGDLSRAIKDVLKDTLTERTAKSYGKDFGKYIGNGISEGMKGSWFPTLSGEVNVKSSGKVSLKLQAYAAGGFPDVGQMFIAREAGAELVGNIGNRSAVVNNDQIVEAVSDGVYRAVVSAMSESQGNNQDIYIDGRKVFEVVRAYNNNERVRTGANPLMG